MNRYEHEYLYFLVKISLAILSLVSKASIVNEGPVNQYFEQM